MAAKRKKKATPYVSERARELASEHGWDTQAVGEIVAEGTILGEESDEPAPESERRPSAGKQTVAPPAPKSEPSKRRRGRAGRA